MRPMVRPEDEETTPSLREEESKSVSSGQTSGAGREAANRVVNEEEVVLIRSALSSQDTLPRLGAKVRQPRALCLAGCILLLAVVFLSSVGHEPSANIELHEGPSLFDEDENVTDIIKPERVNNKYKTKTKVLIYNKMGYKEDAYRAKTFDSPVQDPLTIWEKDEDLSWLTNWLQGEALSFCDDIAALPDMEVLRTSCAAGYTVENFPGTRNVLLYGEYWTTMVKYSGCSIEPGSCPLTPNCTIQMSTRQGDMAGSDVVVVAHKDVEKYAGILDGAKKIRANITRVLFWREHDGLYVPASRQNDRFDLLMSGFSQKDSILNPAGAWPRPISLILPTIPSKSFDNWNDRLFAIDVTSVCDTTSARASYLAHLSSYLGADRIHRYGKCVDRTFPAGSPRDRINFLHRFKFFFVFERVMQKGYISEKLWNALSVFTLPVYYGERLPFNVTTTPSFIHAMDFATPKDLARYLLQLDADKTAYLKYHSWRQRSNPFATDFLHTARKLPGPKELVFGKDRTAASDIAWQTNRASCCRLCNGPFIEKQVRARGRWSLVKPRMERSDIEKVFFAGASLTDIPDSSERLDG